MKKEHPAEHDKDLLANRQHAPGKHNNTKKHFCYSSPHVKPIIFHINESKQAECNEATVQGLSKIIIQPNTPLSDSIM